MSDSGHRGSSGADTDQSFLYEFVCDCPNPIVARAIRTLVDHWISQPTTEPRLVPVDVLKTQLSNEEQIEVSWLLAINPNTPPSVLADLCDGADARLLERIAENERTASATLAKLAYQAVAEIRIATASNSNTSIASIMILVNDDDADVRYSVAENHNVPIEALQVLATDDNTFVKFRAEKTIMRLEKQAFLAGTKCTQQDDDKHEEHV